MATSLISSSLTNLMGSTPEAYKVSASIKDGGVDASSSVVEGDQKSGLFSKGPNGVKKDDFLRLLITQLQNQDPLSPMDNAAMLTQMAQLQSIESSNNIQTALTGLQDSFKGTVDAQRSSALAMTNATSVGLIGKEVRLKQTSINYYPTVDKNATIQVHLGDRSSAPVSILDSEGKVIKTLDAGNKDAENNSVVVWDGSTDSGESAKTGVYSIGFPDDPKSTMLYAFVQDVVSGIRFSGDSALVKVGGKEIPATNIMDVAGVAGTASNGGDSSSAASSVALLGKTVRTRNETFSYGAKENEVAHFDIDLNGLTRASASIIDSKGNVVAQLPVAIDDQGRGSLSWDGRVHNGVDFSPAGSYSIQLDSNAQSFGAYSYTEGVVKGVTTISGSTQVRVGTQLIPVSKIVEIATT